LEKGFLGVKPFFFKVADIRKLIRFLFFFVAKAQTQLLEQNRPLP